MVEITVTKSALKSRRDVHIEQRLLCIARLMPQAVPLSLHAKNKCGMN